MYKNLFEPITINGLTLKNRIILPAMGTRYCTDDGRVIDQLVDYHARRAKGGCGMNVTEAVAIRHSSAVTKMLQISDDSYIEGYKKLTDAIHENGGKACIQLWESGMACMRTPGAKALLPNDLPLGPGMVLSGATVEEIQDSVKAFGEAAKRAVKAGFDSVEFHAAHFYAPHAFLTPAFNKRTDEYGGSLENRARYLLESIREIRRNIPDEMPMLMRIDAFDDFLPNGLTIEDIIEFCKMAKEAGVDVLSISRGNKLVPVAMNYEVPSIDVPRGFNIENAAKIKEATGMPTIGVGRVNDPEQADGYIKDGKIDIIAMGRSQICDPDFANKAMEGRAEDIIRCVGCNQGCYDNCTSSTPITCLRNPEVGREAEFADIKKTENPKKVLVIGGGVGGMEAAARAKSLGHDVILVEKTGELGGQFILAGKSPKKEEMEAAARSRAMQVAKMGIDIRFNTEATEAVLDEINPDAVICAIGASPIMLNLEGATSESLMAANDVLMGNVLPKGDTVVIGGGLVGLETAEYIATKGNKITVVEMLDEAGKDIGFGRKAVFLASIKAAGIEILTNAKCTKIEKTGVIVEQDGELKEISAESVVIAVGSAPNNAETIEKWCQKKGVSCVKIGDAVKARRALNAIHEAVAAAISI